MHVYLGVPDVPSHALRRVERALFTYAPKTVHFVTQARESDLVVLPVIGRRDKVADDVERYRSQGKHVVVCQYVLRSSQKPNTADWVKIWRQARFIWSYYDIPALCAEDGVSDWGCEFYRSPLGVDSAMFQPLGKDPYYLVMTTGRGWLTESVRECVLAAREVGREAVHLGTGLKSSLKVRSVTGISDESLVSLYNDCAFVSGLRRTEGFELPAAEGILCGVRPILFDRPHYRAWFDGIAEFIEETDRLGVQEQLHRLFASAARPVTFVERLAAADRFDWKRIVRGFWERAL